MGANLSNIDPTHVRIYKNLLLVNNPRKRQEILETLMAGQEYIVSAKRAGIYGDLLSYLGLLRSGQRATFLPGEGVAEGIKNQIIIPSNNKDPIKILGKQKNSDKALSFFTTCLRVLDIDEEIAITEEFLKKAYKKKAVLAHPDKGGTEEQFESVTRAYAYLSEILKMVKGQRTRDGEQAVLPAIEAVKSDRMNASKEFAHVEPVRLDPKNMNMEAFNHMFEATRIPDPDDDGYGDWLKDEKEAATAPKFGGKFNRTVFNQVFEEDARKRSSGVNNQLGILGPQELVMAPGFGLEIGREKTQNYTAPANAQLHYTDLRHAYTSGSTFSGEVTGVAVGNRTIQSYEAERKNIGLSEEELSAIAQQEAAMADAERRRQLRVADEHIVANDYFERIKRLVIRDQ